MDFNRLPRFNQSDFSPRQQAGANEPLPEEDLLDIPGLRITRVNKMGEKINLSLGSAEELAQPDQKDKNFLANKQNLFRLMGLRKENEQDLFNLKMTQHRQDQVPLFEKLGLLEQTNSIDEDAILQEISFGDQAYIDELAELYLRIEVDEDHSLAKHAQDLFEFALIHEKPEVANAIQSLNPSQDFSTERVDIWNEVEASQESAPSAKEQALEDLTEMLQERNGFMPQGVETKLASDFELQEQAENLNVDTKLSPRLLVEIAELNERETEVFEYFKQGWILGKPSGNPVLDPDKVETLKKEFAQEDLMFLNSIAKKAVEIDEAETPLLKDYAQSFLKFGVKLNRPKFATKIFDAMPRDFEFKKF